MANLFASADRPLTTADIVLRIECDSCGMRLPLAHYPAFVRAKKLQGQRYKCSRCRLEKANRQTAKRLLRETERLDDFLGNRDE